MEIIFYHPTFDTQYWIRELEKQLPGARVREWKAGDNQPADYALVWHPPVEMLQGRALKAVFALGAGVDSILSKLRDHPDMLPLSIPLFRLEDTGMGRQMQEYAVSQVLHWFRRFDDYQALKLASRWQPLPEYRADEFTIGIMGAGVLGAKVAESLQPWDSRFASGAVAVNPGRRYRALPAGRAGWIPAGDSRPDQPAAEYRRNRRYYQPDAFGAAA